MYGYIRPEKGELKIREYELFRGVYCGLCHTLKERYGPAFRFAVNYDLAFLAMLLAGPEAGGTCPRRCPWHPTRKTACPKPFPALEAAADYTVILAWWKMQDGVDDNGFFGSILCRIGAAAMQAAYGRASALRPAFAAAAEENFAALAELEARNSPSIDATADRFARVLQAAAEGADGADRTCILRELLYHLGRIVYLLDAADDLEDDERSGAYNPLRFRYAPRDGKLVPADEAALRQTMQHSHNSLSAAYELLEKTPYAGVVENVIYFGLPAVTQAVFSGQWKAARKNKKISSHRSDL